MNLYKHILDKANNPTKEEHERFVKALERDGKKKRDKKLKIMAELDIIAQSEFGMDYDQLGKNEKEWVRGEIESMYRLEHYA